MVIVEVVDSVIFIILFIIIISVNRLIPYSSYDWYAKSQVETQEILIIFLENKIFSEIIRKDFSQLLTNPSCQHHRLSTPWHALCGEQVPGKVHAAVIISGSSIEQSNSN